MHFLFFQNSNPSVIVKDLIACLILEHSADTLKFKLGNPSRLLDSQVRNIDQTFNYLLLMLLINVF